MRTRGERYDWEAMAVVTIVSFIGFLMIYLTWGGLEITYKNFYNYIADHGFPFMIYMIFIWIGFYSWFMYINNVLIKPKEKVIFLKDIKDGTYTFLDKKGRKYIVTGIEGNNYNIGSFYLVSKTRNIIKNIIGLSNEKFDNPKEKVSYWLNLNTPIGYLKNLFLLPFLYLFFITGFLSFLMSAGFYKILGFVIMLGPGILIIYDFVQRIKKLKQLKKSEIINNINTKSEELNGIYTLQKLDVIKSKVSFVFSLFVEMLRVVASVYFLITCIQIFINTNMLYRGFIVPFLICILAFLFKSIFILMFLITKKEKNISLSEKFWKIYVLGFLLFYFGFLIIFSYFIIIDSNYIMLLFLIPFWAVGIFIAYRKLKK